MSSAGAAVDRGELTDWTRGYLSELLHIDRDDIRLDQGLVDLGLDSADAILFSAEMEERFGTNIEPQSFLEVDTLQEMIDLVVRTSGGAA